jgi:hypothetical protein
MLIVVMIYLFIISQPSDEGEEGEGSDDDDEFVYDYSFIYGHPFGCAQVQPGNNISDDNRVNFISQRNDGKITTDGDCSNG